MRCKSYRSFSNLFTRRMNVLFATNRIRTAFNIACWAYACDVQEGKLDTPLPIYRLESTVDNFGTEEESKAYHEIVQLMADNPQYVERMNLENTK